MSIQGTQSIRVQFGFYSRLYNVHTANMIGVVDIVIFDVVTRTS